MKTKLVVSLLVAVLLLGTACSLTSLLPGAGSSGTVSALWSDVPPLDGATRENIDLPLPVRLALQAMLQGKLEFIVYTTTKAPQEVRDFYNNDRMHAAGWNMDSSPGCQIGQSQGDSKSGSQEMCIFQKKDGSRDVALVIMMIQDTNTKKTQLFYARVNVEATPAPGAPATPVK